MNGLHWVLISSLALAFAGIGCSSSDSGGSGGSAGSTGGTTSGGGGSGATGGSSGGSGGASGGAAGAGGGSSSAAFCAAYETKCTFGPTGHYADLADCVDKYDNTFDAARQGCVEQHLGFASGPTDLHCTHAAGAAPCN